MTNDSTEDFLTKNDYTKREHLQFDKSPKEGFVFYRYFFEDVSGAKITFTNITFKYCRFLDVYFRNCNFNSCEFIGCKFFNSNLSGSNFVDCAFEYTTFDNTLIDKDILYKNPTHKENLKRFFVRSLRQNYQSLGNPDLVNAAIKEELDATENHLKKCWHSEEDYYRKKYDGITRGWKFLEWFNFKLLDFVWGNGESIYKLFRFSIITMFFIGIIHFAYNKSGCDFVSSVKFAPQYFLGLKATAGFPVWVRISIVVSKIVIVGLFLSLIVKRFNRR